MNGWIGIGRLTKDPEIRYSQSDNLCVARYTLAIDRVGGKEKQTDFISCVAFGKSGEFADKYLHKGMKIAVEGRIQTGSYTDKEGKTRYTTDIVIDRHEFCESKGSSGENAEAPADDPNGWMNVPDGVVEDLPFK